MPDDVQMVAGIGEAVEIRQASYDILTNLIGNVRTMAKNIFKETSMTYKRFGFEGMISANDKDLVHIANRIKTEAAAHAGALFSEGWRGTFPTDFADAITDFDTKRDGVRVAEANRKQATFNRINTANTIYTEVEKICNTGKDVYRESNPAKYRDYIIYQTPGSGPSVVVEGDYAIAETVTADIGGVSTDEESTVTAETLYSPAGYFASDLPDGVPTGTRYDRTAPSTVTMLVEDFKVLIGWSPTKQILRVQNIGMVAGHYKLTFRKLAEE